MVATMRSLCALPPKIESGWPTLSDDVSRDAPVAYSDLKFDAVPDQSCRDAFRKANMLLFDVYGMFRGLPPAGNDGGGGNFSMALVLVCVIDGFSKIMWPLDDQEDRFKRLI